MSYLDVRPTNMNHQNMGWTSILSNAKLSHGTKKNHRLMNASECFRFWTFSTSPYEYITRPKPWAIPLCTKNLNKNYSEWNEQHIVAYVQMAMSSSKQIKNKNKITMSQDHYGLVCILYTSVDLCDLYRKLHMVNSSIDTRNVPQTELNTVYISNVNFTIGHL